MSNEETEVIATGRDLVNDPFRSLDEGEECLLEVARKLVGDKEAVTFEVRQRKVQPEQPQCLPRMESPARGHVFHDADSLAEYLHKYKTDDTVVLIDVSAETAQIILDEKAPKGFERLAFAPVMHPLFEPWAGLLNSKTVQLRSLADFLMQNRRAVREPDAKQLVHLLSQVMVSRSITLQKGFGRHSINGIVCEMDIAGQKQNEQVELPDSIQIETPLYIATRPVILEIDLTVDADDDNVYVTCTSADLIERRVEAFEEMMATIKAIEGVTVGLGAPRHVDWKYVPQNVR